MIVKTVRRRYVVVIGIGGGVKRVRAVGVSGGSRRHLHMLNAGFSRCGYILGALMFGAAEWWERGVVDSVNGKTKVVQGLRRWRCAPVGRGDLCGRSVGVCTEQI